MDDSESLRIQRLATLGKKLDTTIEEFTKLNHSSAENLRDARRAGFGERKRAKSPRLRPKTG